MTAYHAIKSALLAVGCKIPFKVKHEVDGFFDPMLKILAKTPVTKTQTMPDPIKSTIKPQDKIICFVSQKTQPRCQPGYAVKQVTVYHKIVPTIDTYMFTLIANLNTAKRSCIWNHGTQEFIMISSHVYNPSATLCVTKNPTNNVGVTLFPS
jgi:hypothetical protein